MLLASVILLSIATAALIVSELLSSKNRQLYFLLKTASTVSLLALGIVICAYKNSFSGFSILILISVTPMFLSNLCQTFAKEQNPQTDEFGSKFFKKALFSENFVPILNNLSYFLMCLCLSIAGLYVGKETPFGILFGISLGFGLTFLEFILKKTEYSTFSEYFINFLIKLLLFVSAGFLIGQILPVLLYAFNAQNALFCLGLLTLAGYLITTNYIQTKYLSLVYYGGMILLFLGILF